MRYKLIGLLHSVRIPLMTNDKKYLLGEFMLREHEASVIADHLIANGVTIGKDNNVPGKWIPVTERLPENNTAVLVYRPTMAIKIMTSYYYNRFCDGALNLDGDEVITHWMPLPEAPKEGEE